MAFILTVLHIIVSLFLILLILIQAGKGASLSGLFGGGGGEAIFGGGGGDIFLKKMTIVVASLFVLTSLTLAILSSRAQTNTIVKEEPASEMPVNPAGPAQSIPAAPQANPPAPTQVPPAGK
ncbi:MAG: preprotein translocase subunit SecG [bacterium]